MSMRKAINEKCRDCICDPQAGGTWREQTENCIDTTCALHPYRPMSAKGRTASNRPQPEGLRRYREGMEAAK
jgi:hypothetical protein